MLAETGESAVETEKSVPKPCEQDQAASPERRRPYLRIRLILGLATVITGLWAANLALFYWVERTGLQYLLGAYARYVCAYGGFAALIFGGMLINEFLVLRKALKEKDVVMAKPSSEKPPPLPDETKKPEKAKRSPRARRKKRRKKTAVVPLAIILFMLCPVTVNSIVSYTATVLIEPKLSASVYYRSNTGSNLLASCKERVWNGSAWSSENEMPTSGSSVRFVRAAYCPIQSRGYEIIVVTLSSDGYLDACVWDHLNKTWVVTNNIGFVGTTANSYRSFDIAYEKTSGRALIVYSRGTTTNEIGYRIWDGVSWSSEQPLDLQYTTGVVYWIALATKPIANANEIAMIYLDANADVHGYVWTGSAWSLMGATTVWETSAAIATEECIAVAYEQTSGRAMFIWGDSISTDNYYRIWDGSTLGATTLLDIPAQGWVSNWVTLKADPATNGIVYLVVDGASDLNTAFWDGTAWTVHPEHDSAVNTNARRCADFEWEPTGSKGLLVWGTAFNSLSYKRFSAPSTWSGTSTIATTGFELWVQLRRNPRDAPSHAKILGAILDSNFDLGALKWDGSTLTNMGDSIFTSDTTVTTYECFNILFSDPS